MAENAKETGLRLLRERAERLNKILHMAEEPNGTHPSEDLVTHEVLLIIKAIFLFSPKLMGSVLAEEMARAMRLSGYFCLECGEPIPVSKGSTVSGKEQYCGECYKNIQAEIALALNKDIANK